jgi:hypothetical protein
LNADVFAIDSVTPLAVLSPSNALNDRMLVVLVFGPAAWPPSTTSPALPPMTEIQALQAK